MKTIIYTTILFSICTICWGEEYIRLQDGVIVKGKQYKTMPVRNIETVEGGIIVTYSFDYVAKHPDDIFPSSSVLTIDGFVLGTDTETPVLPLHWDTFRISPNEDYSIKVLDSAYIELPMEIAPVRTPLLNNSSRTSPNRNVSPIKPYQGFFPQNVLYCKPNKYRSHPLVDVCINPIQYDYNSKTVRMFKKLTYFIQTKDDNVDTLSTKVLPDLDPLLSNIILNPIKENHNRDVNSTTMQIAVPRYLIITVPKYASAVNKFADWKRTQGFKVDIISQTSWTSTTVKNTIINENQQDSVRYLLIVGDNEDVPGENKTKQLLIDNYWTTVNYYTDYNYGRLNLGDFDADIRRGRLSVSTATEAMTVVDKIINYEKEPCTNSSFYQKGINCAYFQDASNDGYEDLRFTLTSEEIRNYLINKGKIVNRIYYTQQSVNPLYWNKGGYGFNYDNPIPTELLRNSGFQWDGDSVDIINEINNGVFYAMYNGHGYGKVWRHLSFGEESVGMLENGNKLPVVFSISCLTGMYNVDVCLAEALLRKQNGGAVGIIAASHLSICRYNDALALGIINAIWPNPGLIYTIPNNSPVVYPTVTPVYRLGDILDQGLYSMRYSVNIDLYTQHTKELYHCFGDPAMEIYTDTPTPFENVFISQDENNYYSVVVGEDATITFYNTITGNIDCFYGNSVEYPADNNIRICISAHNKIPYIFEPLFIQNEIISSTGTRKADVIKVGSNVTSSKPTGEVRITSGKTTLIGNTVELNGETTIVQGAQLEIRNN